MKNELDEILNDCEDSDHRSERTYTNIDELKDMLINALKEQYAMAELYYRTERHILSTKIFELNAEKNKS